MQPTKQCPKCSKILPLNEFSKKGTRPSQSHCHKCKACQRIYSKEHYRLNRTRHLAKHYRYHATVVDFVQNYKTNNPCLDCKQFFHFSAMDFDHVVGTKSFNLSACRSMPQVKNEMQKCELVCANCHRLRTWLRTQLKKPSVGVEPT